MEAVKYFKAKKWLSLKIPNLRLWNVAHCLPLFGGGVKRGRQQVVTKNSETGGKLRVLLVDFEIWRSWGPTFLQALPLPAFYAHTLWRLSPDPHCIGGQLPKKDAGIWQISSGMWVQQLSRKNLHTLKFLWRSEWIPNIEMIQSLLGMWMDYEGANGCWSPTFAHTSPSAPTWLYFVST